MALEYVDGLPGSMPTDSPRQTVRERVELIVKVGARVAHAHEEAKNFRSADLQAVESKY